MTTFDYIVVGKGLIGSAATRYLAEMGQSVAVIGPDEPADTTTHTGVFASHYDQGRIVRQIGKDKVWARAGELAIKAFPDLESHTDVQFHQPVGGLFVAPSATRQVNLAQTLNHAHTHYTDSSWQPHFPQFQFPVGYEIVHEPAPAGYINPRDLIRAQLAAAQSAGATVISDTVLRVNAGILHTIHTATNNSHHAKQVLLATNAFTNFHNLLPQKLDLKLKTETIVLAQVSFADYERLKETPFVIYQIEDPDIDDIYMTPPILYPDGKPYIKIGANTRTDSHPATLADVQAWFHQGDSDSCQPAFAHALSAIWRDVDFVSLQSKRCVVCYTPTGYPMIDEVEQGLFVAVGGNGSGAKSSDTWGRVAASLMANGTWLADFPRDSFRASFA